MAPSPSPPSGTTTPPAIPDDTHAPSDLPLDMVASIMLTALPQDAASALASAGTFDVAKVTVRFQPVGNAPPLRQQVCKISSSQRFEQVVAYLRKKLLVGEGMERERESVFLYVGSSFAPALDEVVGNLHRCFKDSSGQLVVSYSMTPAFG